MTRFGNLEVRPVEAGGPLLEEWNAVYAAALRRAQGEYATIWQLQEVRVLLERRTDRRFDDLWAGLVDGRVVTTGSLRGSHRDNREAAEVEVTTHPEDRGRGYAAAMLDALEGIARERGRTQLLGEIAWAIDDPAGAASPDLRWARAHGFEVGLVDVQRRLSLPVATEVLDALAAEAAAYHQGYELRSFLGPVPDDLLAGWAALVATLITEAPTGDIEREVEDADVAGVRETEALLARQGRIKANTAVLSPEGEVVAYTDLGITEHESDRAYQWGTLVRRDHRGHRLGMAVKVANLRLLQEVRPQISTVITYNAEVNAPMIGVNERLGFVPVQRMGELHKRSGEG